MARLIDLKWAVAALLLCSCVATQAAEPGAVLVTPDNFPRAESDLYFANIAKDDGFGKFKHHREMSDVKDQQVIRLNRDTLYSAAVFDLDAGPVTVTLPDAGKRFMSMQVIDEDQYTHQVAYKAGEYTFSRKKIGTRYVLIGVRTLVDPDDPADLATVHSLQDGIKVKQKASGSLELPAWDRESQGKVRAALLALADTLPDTNRMFGMKDQVDPVRRLIGSASAWGGNPAKDATYLNVIPAENDGKTVYRLSVGKVPVDGFWSISVYNAKGYYEPNAQNAYTLNNLTAKPASDGSFAIQFGGCDAKTVNCLPTVDGWNYMVRLYRPQPAVLAGKWRFPEAEPLR